MDKSNTHKLRDGKASTQPRHQPPQGTSSTSLPPRCQPPTTLRVTARLRPHRADQVADQLDITTHCSALNSRGQYNYYLYNSSSAERTKRWTKTHSNTPLEQLIGVQVATQADDSKSRRITQADDLKSRRTTRVPVIHSPASYGHTPHHNDSQEST